MDLWLMSVLTGMSCVDSNWQPLARVVICALVDKRLCPTFVLTPINTFCYAERRRPELHTECYFAYPRQATSTEVVNANRTPRLRRAMQSTAGAKRTCFVASLSRFS